MRTAVFVVALGTLLAGYPSRVAASSISNATSAPVLTTTPEPVDCGSHIQIPSGVYEYLETLVQDLGYDVSFAEHEPTFCELYEAAVEEIDAILDTLQNTYHVDIASLGLSVIDLESSCDDTLLELYAKVEAVIYNSYVETYWFLVFPNVDYDTVVEVMGNFSISLEAALEFSGHTNTTLESACPQQCVEECHGYEDPSVWYNFTDSDNADNCSSLVDIPSEAFGYLEDIVESLGYNVSFGDNPSFCELYGDAVDEIDDILRTLEDTYAADLESLGLHEIDLEASCNATVLEIYAELEAVIANPSVEAYWSAVLPDVEYDMVVSFMANFSGSLQLALEIFGHTDTTVSDACPQQCLEECANEDDGDDVEDTTSRCGAEVVSVSDLDSELLEKLFETFGGDDPTDFCSAFHNVVSSIDDLVTEDLSAATDCASTVVDIVTAVDTGLAEIDAQTYSLLAYFTGVRWSLVDCVCAAVFVFVVALTSTPFCAWCHRQTNHRWKLLLN
mgnify:CR=1 FL=1